MSATCSMHELNYKFIHNSRRKLNKGARSGLGVAPKRIPGNITQVIQSVA